MSDRKKGIFITSYGKSESIGVEKKIASQLKVFEQNFKMERLQIDKCNVSFVKKVLSWLPGGSVNREYEYALQKIKEFEPDFFYLRRSDFDRKYMSFIKKIREVYPQAKIVMEFPTYPYDGELLHSKTMWPWFFKDHIYRNELKKYVDRIVTFSLDDSIFGIKTIRIINGIELASYK